VEFIVTAVGVQRGRYIKLAGGRRSSPLQAPTGNRASAVYGTIIDAPFVRKALGSWLPGKVPETLSGPGNAIIPALTTDNYYVESTSSRECTGSE